MNKVNIDTMSIDQIPLSESELYEFKSSRIKNDKKKGFRESLKEKLCKAVSGFANSGGGYFIVGIDEDTGNVDGGIPIKVEQRPIEEWVDTIIHQYVEPAPKYERTLINNPKGRGIIDQDCSVLVVYIYESYVGPHMTDYKYYIRAGEHTLPARNFIVEAIRAKRYESKPKLTHLFRFKPGNEQVLQLGIIALTDAPALDTSINISPLPKRMEGREKDFPIGITLIDRNNPFYFDVSLFAESNDKFGDNITLLIEYCDVYNNKYNDERIIGVNNATPPITIGNPPDKKIVQALESIEKALGKINSAPKHISKPNITPPTDLNIFDYVEKLVPELLTEMRTDLANQPYVREFIIISKNWLYNQNPNNDIFEYYFETHSYLRNKLRILENCNLIYEITYNTTDRFVMTEQFVEYLTGA